MTRNDLHEELAAFAELVSDRIIQKFSALQDEIRRRAFEELQAQSQAQLRLDQFRVETSRLEAEAEAEAQRKKAEHLELLRLADRTLLSSAELTSFELGGDLPSDYADRVEKKRQAEEEAELGALDVTLLTDAEYEVYSQRRELPPDYRDRALRARESRREKKRLAECYDHQDLLSGEERLRFQAEGIIPTDFEERLKAAKPGNTGTGVVPGAPFRLRA